MTNLFLDVTSTISATNKYEFLATHDELTKLPNRRKIDEMFDKKIKHNKSFSVLVLDLDKFKDVNDTYGHLIGDEFLIKFANHINIYNNETTLAARYGGDEFLFIIDNEESNLVEKISNEVISLFNKPFNVNGHLINSQISIGISTYCKDGTTISELIDKADNALYKAKKSKNNKIVYYT